ncbi:hypothetical protein BW34_01058 [Microbacterium oleivorans]|uniref:Uncharacterized protein n=2 Tax=Microbacterium oleivorans TaxID=273677 RepID=A0A031FV60_9MICO|nr:hypothetical protein BW34_01058 [Microbacterium oleivorans]
MEERNRVEMIASLNQEELWYMTGEVELTVGECEAILDRGDVSVRVALASNPDVPQSVLAVLANLPDPVGRVARENTNAPPEAKDLSPIGLQASYGITLYLEQRGANRRQAQFVADEYERGPHPGGRPLRDVWAEASDL